MKLGNKTRNGLVIGLLYLTLVYAVPHIIPFSARGKMQYLMIILSASYFALLGALVYKWRTTRFVEYRWGIYAFLICSAICVIMFFLLK